MCENGQVLWVGGSGGCIWGVLVVHENVRKTAEFTNMWVLEEMGCFADKLKWVGKVGYVV